jgi:hypothetical protein
VEVVSIAMKMAVGMAMNMMSLHFLLLLSTLPLLVKKFSNWGFAKKMVAVIMG